MNTANHVASGLLQVLSQLHSSRCEIVKDCEKRASMIAYEGLLIQELQEEGTAQ